MKELIEKINKFIKSSLPKEVSEELQKSMEAHASAEYALSLKYLSESMFILLRDEYYKPEFSDLQEGMNSVQMLRDLRSSGKELDKSSSDAILRIQERAGLESIDEIILESCYEGAVQVFENFIRENRKKEEKRNTTSTKGPGKYILEEVEELLAGSTEKSKVLENFTKLEKIYLKYPQNKEIHKAYFLCMAEVDKHRSKVEIIEYLEKGGVIIHMGSVCISLLASLGELIEAKEWLGWYEEEYPNEVDGTYAEAMVFLHSYLKEGRESDLRRLEGLSSKLVEREDSYYIYIRNCYEIFFGREGSIREKSIGLYQYKELQYRELIKKWRQEKEKLGEEFNKKKQAEVEAIKAEDKNPPAKPIEEERMDSNPVVKEKGGNQEIKSLFIEIVRSPNKSMQKILGGIMAVLVLFGIFLMKPKSNSYYKGEPSGDNNKQVMDMSEEERLTVEGEKRAECENQKKDFIKGECYSPHPDWSPYMGEMNWDDAKEKCRSEGMRLPTLVELKAAYNLGLTEAWKKDGNDYWLSTPYDAESYYFLKVYNGTTYYNHRSLNNNVRCRR